MPFFSVLLQQFQAGSLLVTKPIMEFGLIVSSVN